MGMIRCSGSHTDSNPAASASWVNDTQLRGPTIIVMPNFTAGA
jgi:hypothetical protein